MTTPAIHLTPFAADVLEGLSKEPQKELSAQYFYDSLGGALFDAITLLPEYGVTRADERLLQDHAAEIAGALERNALVVELGSGSGRKTTHVLRAVTAVQGPVTYRPIDVCEDSLLACQRSLAEWAKVEPVVGDYLKGLQCIASRRNKEDQLLLLFLGSTIGNFNRSEIPGFLRAVRAQLQQGDLFLLGADLLKDVDTMVAAYDDPTGVTAAFNLNLLARINRELDGDFDLRCLQHEARWNETERRIEMHLAACRDMTVRLNAIDFEICMRAGETIWTESSHKFTVREIVDYAAEAGFEPVTTWVDGEWPFAESLWRAA